jgi:hypothetical protein
MKSKNNGQPIFVIIGWREVNKILPLPVVDNDSFINILCI